MHRLLLLPGLSLLICLTPTALRAQWTQTSGPGRAPALVSHSDGTLVQLGLQKHGVYRSTDHGSTWIPSSGLDGATPTCFAQNPTYLFAGLEDLDGPGGVYRSSDGGATWQAVNNGLGDRWILSLLTVGNTIYAGDFSMGAFRSTDNGGSWSPANQGIATETIRALARSGTTLFAAGTNNLYQSTDGGANWEFTNGGQYFPIAGMAAFGNQIYAGGFQGLIRSTDGGQSWSDRIDVPFIGSVDRLTSFALDGATLYASTISSPGSGGSGVIRSTDQGLNWQPASAGIALVGVNHVILDGTRLIAAAPDKGPLVSTDGGGSWVRRIIGLPPGGSVRELKGLSGVIYAGAQGDGVYGSTDAGASWASSSAEPSGVLANETVLSLLIEQGLFLAGTAYHGIFRSTDGGVSWAASNAGLPGGVIQALDLVRAGANILLGTGDGLFFSTDGGLSWNPTTLQNATIPALAAADGFAYSVYISGISQFDGIYRSTNSGFSWTRVFNSLDTSYIAGMEAEGPFVYAGVFIGGLLRSTDHGTTWGPSPPEPGLGVFSLLTTSSEVFAGSEGSGAGVYRSTNHGASWAPLGDGLPGGQGIESLGSAGSFLFAATDELGVWRRFHQDPAGIEPELAGVSPLELSVLGPNPIHQGTVIELRLPQAESIELRLFDVGGRMLRRLASGEHAQGVHRIAWRPDGLPAGTYILRLDTPEAMRAAKLLIIR